MGSPEFAVKSLSALHNNNFNIVSVVTVPDKPQGRGLKIKYSPVKKYAIENNLPLLQPEKLKDGDFIKALADQDADVFVVVAFKILPYEVFSIPPSGTINVHASLLPKYRGAAPINWAIINGEKETGVTTMRIDAKVDTGDILLQKSVNIDENMTAGELHDILAIEGAHLLINTLNNLNNIKPRKQDASKISKAPKLKSEAGLIDFSKNANDVHNHIRGLSPYPGAYTYFKSKKLKILKSENNQSNIDNVNSGTVSSITKNSVEVICGKGSVYISKIHPEGKRGMSAKEFVNGFHLKVGDKFQTM